MADDINNEKKFIAIRLEARRISKKYGLIYERELQSEWANFVEQFRTLGATKLRWYEEWTKHCSAYKHPYLGTNSDDELRECF